MAVFGNPLSRSLLGAKRTCPFELHMSKQTPPLCWTTVQLGARYQIMDNYQS